MNNNSVNPFDNNISNPSNYLDSEREFFSPASRAYFAFQEGKLSAFQLYRNQPGKLFFNNNVDIQPQNASEYIEQHIPPLDGRIASANHENACFLDEPGSHWTKHEVVSGGKLTVTWNQKCKSSVNRWSYFLTRSDWNPERPLTRDQFQERPLYTTELTMVDAEDSDNQLAIHELILPERTGYHVLLAIMEDAEHSYAYYQVVDLLFILYAQLPPAPYGLRATSVSQKSISLTWDYPANPIVYKYEIYRDNKKLTFGPLGSSKFYTDDSVKANTEYTYAIQAFTINAEYSPLSETIRVRTLGGNYQPAPPEPPVNLHFFDISSNSVRLSWKPVSIDKQISHYRIYRNDTPVGTVTYPSYEFLDTDLHPNTKYTYYVVSVNIYNLSSTPSESIAITTYPAGGIGYPDWKAKKFYPVGARVYSFGHNWRCVKAHVSYCVSGQPGKFWVQI